MAIAEQIRAADALVSLDLHCETILFALPDGAFLELGPVGSRTWGSLAPRTGSFVQLVGMIEAELEATRPITKRDASEFLYQLSQRNLINVACEFLRLAKPIVRAVSDRGPSVFNCACHAGLRSQMR